MCIYYICLTRSLKNPYQEQSNMNCENCYICIHNYMQVAINPYSKYVSVQQYGIFTYKYSCQARLDKHFCYRTNNYLMPLGHLIWTLTWTSYFKYKLRQLLFVCVAGKPISKHIYISTFGSTWLDSYIYT